MKLVPAVSYVTSLSPRVRGSHLPTKPLFDGAGSIPACAGEPQGLPGPLGPGPVYPRVCGGAAVSVRSASISGDGSIPACAGEPLQEASGSAGRGVYPRVCG